MKVWWRAIHVWIDIWVVVKLSRIVIVRIIDINIRSRVGVITTRRIILSIRIVIGII